MVIRLFILYFFISFIYADYSYTPNETICWITTPNINGTNSLVTCPFGFYLQWENTIPKNLDIVQSYVVGYSVYTKSNLTNLVINCSHANIHACESKYFCTPLIPDYSILSTLDKAKAAVPLVKNTCGFTSVVMPGKSFTPGNYTLIAHVGLTISNGGDISTYALAIGEYKLFYTSDTLINNNKVPDSNWLIPAIVLPLAALIVIVFILWKILDKPSSQEYIRDIPESLLPFFDISYVRSKYKLKSRYPRVYKCKIKFEKKSIENDLLKTVMKNMDFRDILIDNGYAVYPETIVTSFFIRRGLYRREAHSATSAFYNDNWKQAPNLHLRDRVITEFKKKIQLWPWNVGCEDITQIPVLAVVHATEMESAWKIINSGFVALQKLDSGYYGKGIYLTSSAWYTIQYCTNAEKPCIMICLVIPCNPYPVTESPKDAVNFNGRVIMPGYQSHYVLTTLKGSPLKDRYYEKVYDEIVIQGEDQVLPIFLLTVNKGKLQSTIKKFNKEIQRENLNNSVAAETPSLITSKIIDDSDGLNNPNRTLFIESESSHNHSLPNMELDVIPTSTRVGLLDNSEEIDLNIKNI